MEKPGEAAQITAVPPAAEALVEDGQVDPKLFDLSHLMQEDLAASEVPVTVHFDEPTTASKAGETADALPGSIYVAGTATDQQATVSVPAGSGTEFWDAVTQPREYDPDTPEGGLWGPDDPATPRKLAPGIAGLTLDGAPLANEPEPMLNAPSYRLTVRLHAPSDRSKWIEPDFAFGAIREALIGVTGPLASEVISLTSRGCEDPECSTFVQTYLVPAGVYWFEQSVYLWRYGYFANALWYEPQVEVNGDTVVDLYGDDLIWMSPRTHRPSELSGMAITKTRTLPDGLKVSNLHVSKGDGVHKGYYIAPTQNRATTGAYNVVIEESHQQPRISMRLSDRGRGNTALRIEYPYSPETAIAYLAADSERFEIVDGGVGSAEDFDRVDAAGKLVLVRPDPDREHGVSRIHTDVMERAQAEGAAAVIADPTCEWLTEQYGCATPIEIWRGLGAGPYPELPLATVGREDVPALRERLHEGEVTVVVDSPPHQMLEYVYLLAHHFQGGVPTSIDLEFGPERLVTRNTRVHESADAGELRIGFGANFRHNAFSVGYPWESRVSFPESVEITEYFGPVNPDARWTRRWDTDDRPGFEDMLEVLTDVSVTDESFFASPVTVGPPEPPAFRVDDPWNSCSFCRLGNVVYPFTSLVTGASPRHRVASGILSNMVLTDADGTEIPTTVDSSGFIPIYELPAERQEYTLTAGTSSGSYELEWKFTSGTAEENRPPHTSCLNERYYGNTGCGEALPMIYVRYDAPVDIDNTAPAASRHTVEVTPYHHGADAPEIERPDVQVSFDGGETWQDTRVTRGQRDAWRVRFTVPELEETNGFVALRTSAEDAEGNSTVQTTMDAYALR